MSPDQSFYVSAIGHFKLSLFKEKARKLKQRLLIIYGRMFLTTTFFKNSETLSGVN
jgi:hypothetical protein